jgi:hypothetical protein
VVDLLSAEGSAMFGARWRTMEAKIVEVPAIPNSMAEYQTTYDISPHAGEEGFDDSSWPTTDPKGLADRRGGGKVSFIWFRSSVTRRKSPAGSRSVIALIVLRARCAFFPLCTRT